MNWDSIREEFETSDITLKALAEKHDIKLGTLKSRKSRESWSRDATIKVATSQPKKKKVATSKKQKRRSGNPNPKNQFSERNTAALKHGLFSRYMPKATLEIMNMLDEASPADLLWGQIQIQYAAVIRAQEIMHVKNKDEMIKELKKSKFETVMTKEGEYKQIPTEIEYEFQFAWDRQATFLNAQSKALAELRGSIKQFLDLTHSDDERRLKLEQMRLNIDKTKAEIDNIKEDEEEKPIEVIIKRKER